MNLAPQSLSRFRHQSWSLLVVGILAGVTIGGGVGVIAASSTKTVTVCSDKKTDVLRYAKNGHCTTTETKVVLNQTGSTGDTGTVGATGDTGVAGTNGAAGAKGDTGAAGTNGTAGAKGDTGAPGTNGAAGATGATGFAGASFTTGFTAQSVCGAGRTTLCAVGEQGPGGGTIFYVDTAGKYGDFDYLELAPADASTSVAWSTTTETCGVPQVDDCERSFITTSGEALKYLAIGTGRAATAAIVARHDAGLVPKSDYAAGIADAYTTATASDWWLPSKGELNEMCKYARTQTTGDTTIGCTISGALRGGFASGFTFHWSSSESGAYGACTQSFYGGSPGSMSRNYATYVRPVRGF